MFVPLFPFSVPIPLIREQLLPLNRPALLCTACAAHRASSSFSLNKGKGIGSPLCHAAPEDTADPVPTPPIPLGQKAGESKGVLPLVLGVQGPGGPWRIFAYFLYVRK